MKLKIVQNTVFKDRPLQSHLIAYNRKISAYAGTEFEIETYNLAESNHFKIVFIKPLPRNYNLWYVFCDHVEIVDENNPEKSGQPDSNVASNRDKIDTSLGWIWPMKGTSMGSRTEFGYSRGRLHAGVDIGGYTPDECCAASHGTVTYVKRDTSDVNGRMIEITRPDGWKHVYLHLQSILVELNQEIEIGQLIAIRGGSGFGSEGLEIDGGGYSIHLHFEIHNYEGIPVNPRLYLPDDGSVPIVGY
ncbi:M23 family metallopeptidase [Capilliphycus salinus ALCB114379]|uniref:M23 family metallopeptidase n=1 Tax=Capilliphycus salinus TaxID=2768948 RepID=UPI0039A71917